MKVTILTPTLNAARHLDACLRSVRDQADPRELVEHLVLDGGSTDGTVEAPSASGAHVSVERDGSLYEALNRGIDLAGPGSCGPSPPPCGAPRWARRVGALLRYLREEIGATLGESASTLLGRPQVGW